MARVGLVTCLKCSKAFKKKGCTKYCSRSCWSNRGNGRVCVVDGCDGKHEAKGYCALHYKRYKKYADPLPDKPRRTASGFTFTSGYRGLYRTGKQLLEHRVVMEEHLGRKLSFNEVVHHKDHDRANNSIDNLEVLSRSEHTTVHMRERWGA